MGKQARIRKNRRQRNPQVDPELQLWHDHKVLAEVRAAKRRHEEGKSE
jgi:hypothetical protein